MPQSKRARGYRFVKDKFGISGLTPQPSETVAAPRVRECPVQLEAVVEATHGVAETDDKLGGRVVTFEVRVQRVHAHESILMRDRPDHIDPDKWRPLIMSFQRFYGLGEELHESTLSGIPERMYRSPDVDRARSSLRLAQVA